MALTGAETTGTGGVVGSCPEHTGWQWQWPWEPYTQTQGATYIISSVADYVFYVIDSMNSTRDF